MENTPLTVAPKQYPSAVRFVAHLASILFHPIFIPGYVTAWLLYLHPYAFDNLPGKMKSLKLISVVLNTAFLPAFSIFLMRRLNLIQSIYLRTQRDRIIPYALSMIFYFWAWWVSHNQDDPVYYKSFMLGTFITVIAAWMLNIVMKISMHALASGGLVMFFFMQAFSISDTTGLYCSLAILIAGLVCTSRFIVSDHTPREIYIGLLAGAACQLLGYWF